MKNVVNLIGERDGQITAQAAQEGFEKKVSLVIFPEMSVGYIQLQMVKLTYILKTIKFPPSIWLNPISNSPDI